MNHIALTDRARQLEASTQYQHLKKAPKNRNIKTWLQQWECTYAECKKLSLPDVQNDCTVYDFLQAISSLAPNFSSVWTINLQVKADAKEDLPNLYKIIEMFRNHHRLVSAQKESASHSAFAATLQGQPAEEEKEKEKEKKSPCLCGEIH